MDWIQQWQSKLNKQNGVAPLVRTGGSRHTGLAALPYRNIHQGALLRMNRSIQAEGTFGIIKYDRWYKRIVRRGIKSVQLEVYLVSLGHNLYKFHNKQMKIKSVA